MFCKKIMVSLISMTAVCGMGIAAPSVRATTTSPSTVDTTVRAGTLRVPMARSTTTTSGATSVKNDTTGSSPRMAYISGTGIGKLSTRLQQPAPASASALSELERKVRELTDYVANVPETATEAKSTAEANATEITTLRSELGGKLDAEDFAEQFDTRATEKSLIDSDTVSSVYATKEELSSVPTSRAFTELTGRVDDAAADIITLNTELGRKLDKDTADYSYASLAALQGVKNTADAAVTPTMLNTTLAEYAKTEDLENIPSSEAFTSLSGRVGSAETNIATLQSNLAGKANAGDSYTKSESDAQLQAAKTSAVSDAKAYADEKFNNIEIPDVDLSDYYKSAQVDTLLANKAAASDVATLSNKINDATTGLDTKLSTTDAANTYALKSALNGLATEGYVTNKINDIAIPDVSELTGRVDTAETNIATLQSTASGHTTAISDINTALTNKLDIDTAANTYATQSALNDKADAGDLTTLSNKVNDATTGLAATYALASSKLDSETADATYAAKTALNDKADASAVTALSGRVDTAEGNITALQSTTSGHTTAISDINTALTNKLDTDTAANTYALKSALNDLASTEYVDNKVSDKVTTTQLNNVLADYDTSAQTTAKIQTATAGLATTGYVDEQISNIDIPDPDLSEYYKSQQVDTLLAGKLDNDALDDYDTSAQTTAKIQTATAGLATTGYVDNKVSDKVTTTQLNTALSDKVTTNQFNTALNAKLDTDTAAATYATKTALQGVQATAEAAVTPLLLSDTLSGYATKEYAASLAPDVELDYDSNTNALVYRNNPTDEWRSIPISGLQGNTPLLEANDARQAIRVSYDNGQTYTTLIPYETLKGPKGDKGDPGCDSFELETEETETGSKVNLICVTND